MHNSSGRKHFKSEFPSVFITQTPYVSQNLGEDSIRLSEAIRETYRRGKEQPFRLVENAKDAEIVVFWEEYQATEQTLAPKLRAKALEIGDPDKVFVVSMEDRPAGFLPGVYAGNPIAGWNEHRFRSGPYFHVMNPLIDEAARASGQRPNLLFTFVGAATATVRREIFGTFKTGPNWHIQETGNLQFNINANDPAKRPGQREYLKRMLESAFVLCPRGCGVSSYRLFETMQLGRVPVILSDNYTLPRGPNWPGCSIRIAERHVGEIARILEAFLPQATEMGRLARAEWEHWFKPDISPLRTLQWIHDIYLSRPHSEVEYVKNWPNLAWRSKWPPPLRLRIQRKLSKLRRRLTDLRSAS